MLNEIISIFDADLRDKCWIGNYGGLAITAKQSFNGTKKLFPLSCELPDECGSTGESFNKLVPDSSKTGVAFWRIIQPVTTTPAKGISYRRNMMQAECVLEFVAWVNIKMITGESDVNTWCSDPGNIIRDAVKSINCQRGSISTGIEYIKNLRLSLVQIGDIGTFKQAMSGYSFDNLEALTTWPYSGFTIRVKLSFLVAAGCIPDLACADEIDCSEKFYVVDENDNMLSDGIDIIVYQ